MSFNLRPKALQRAMRRLMVKARIRSLLHWETTTVSLTLNDGDRLVFDTGTELVGPGPVHFAQYSKGRKIVSITRSYRATFVPKVTR